MSSSVARSVFLFSFFECACSVPRRRGFTFPPSSRVVTRDASDAPNETRPPRTASRGAPRRAARVRKRGDTRIGSIGATRTRPIERDRARAAAAARRRARRSRSGTRLDVFVFATTSGRAVREKHRKKKHVARLGVRRATIARGTYLEEGGRDRGARLCLAGKHLARSRRDRVGVVLPVEPSLVPARSAIESRDDA